jgi:uncharacterized RDD family membrane protein YckC
MHDYAPAGLFRRLAAALYDALVVFALCMLTTLTILAFRRGEAVGPGNFLFQLSLLATAAFFYVGFWVKGGQTIGMRAWRIRVERQTGEPLDWRTALSRFIAGMLCILPAGLGLFWMILDRRKLTWYDRMTHTRVVVLPPRSKQCSG